MGFADNAGGVCVAGVGGFVGNAGGLCVASGGGGGGGGGGAVVAAAGAAEPKAAGTGKVPRRCQASAASVFDDDLMGSCTGFGTFLWQTDPHTHGPTHTQDEKLVILALRTFKVV